MRAFAQQPSSFISYELSTLSARSLCWVLGTDTAAALGDSGAL